MAVVLKTGNDEPTSHGKLGCLFCIYSTEEQSYYSTL